MSTRSAIIVKVRKEDINGTFKFDKKKLPCKLSEWEGDASKDKSKKVEIKESYIGIYCHWDGYFDGVGSVLKEKFNDYDSVLNLIVGGSCSVVWFDNVRHYANRKGEEWKYLKPIQGSTPFEVAENIGHNGYVYLFEDGKWKAQDGNRFVEYDENGLA